MNKKPTAKLAQPLLDLIAEQQPKLENPCFVALDGRSGSGKSTLAAYIAGFIPSTSVIEGDEFYTGGSFEMWSSRSVRENAKYCIDWRRQHSIISTLKSKGYATWNAFDWDSEQWDSDIVPYCSAVSTCSITTIILLEGVYSARTELASLFDIRVMLEAPDAVGKKQLADREGENARPVWEQLWLDAEQHYFEHMLDRRSLSLTLA